MRLIYESVDMKTFKWSLVLLVCLALFPATNTTKKSREDAALPKILLLDVAFNQSFTLSLKLKKNDEEIMGSEVLRDDSNGDMVATPADKTEHTGIYKSNRHHAIFTVTAFKNQTHHTFVYMGSFGLEKREYNMLPADYNEAALGDKVEKEWVVEIGGSKYKVSLLQPAHKLKLDHDDLVAEPKKVESYADVFKEVDEDNEVGGEKEVGGEDETGAKISKQTNGQQLLIMEILILIDDSTYKKFRRFCKNNHKSTVSHLKFYYTHVMNGVSDTYERINHPAFHLQPVVTAIYIARTPAEAPFTNSRHIRAVSGTIDGTQVLLTMDKWVKAQVRRRKINWPTFDMTVMFHDLYTPEILGLAYTKQICLNLAVAMVMNTGTFETILTATHEIGHIMGAKHDEAKECIAKHQYIMFPASMGDNGTFDNEKVFSSCSINMFAVHIRDLKKLKRNCMKNRPSCALQPLNGRANSQTFLGQKYKLNEQCVLTKGTGSTYCGTETGGDGLCANIQCTLPSENKCSGSKNNRAMDGTSCGNRMWCLYGRCVADARAPQFTAQGGCQNKMKWCPTYVSENPSTCEETYLRSNCCASCSSQVGK